MHRQFFLVTAWPKQVLKTRQERCNSKNMITNTYDASKSKYSTSSAIIGALPAAAELEEAISSTRFLKGHGCRLEGGGE
jgi:hypothetical protein